MYRTHTYVHTHARTHAHTHTHTHTHTHNTQEPFFEQQGLTMDILKEGVPYEVLRDLGLHPLKAHKISARFPPKKSTADRV